MSTSSVAPPRPYKESCLGTGSFPWRIDHDLHVVTVAPRGCVFGYYPRSPEREVLVDMIAGNEYRAKLSLTRTSMAPRQICRVELFVSSPDDRASSHRMGAVFFDGHGNPLVHILSATLFRDGWPLTEELLQALNVSEHVLIGLRVMVGKLENYHVILSREVITERDGQQVVYPAGRPRREWEWWSA